MECPYRIPIHKSLCGDFFDLIGKNGKILFRELTEQEADYIVQSINSHEKLVKLILKAGKADHFIGAIYSGMPTSRKVGKLLEKSMEELKPIRRYVYDFEQALKKAEKP